MPVSYRRSQSQQGFITTMAKLGHGGLDTEWPSRRAADAGHLSRVGLAERSCKFQAPEILHAMTPRDAAPASEDGSGIERLLWILTPREKEVFLLPMQSLKYHNIAARLK